MRERSKLIRPVSKNEPPVPIVPSLNIEEATWTDCLELQQHLISQVYDTLWLPQGVSDEKRMAQVESAISLLEGIKPVDVIEGMLAVQMVSTHNAALEWLRRAMIPGQTIQAQDQAMKHATKLLSIYSRQTEVLNKHRGKGQPKMTVERVNVQSGGQAVVGHIETGSKARSPREDASPKPTASPKTRQK